MAQNEIYTKIVQDIIDGLKQGVVAWQMPYKLSVPVNCEGKAYRGGNRAVLQFKTTLKGYTSNQWATFNQIRKVGGCVKKGEKGTAIAFYKIFKKTDEATGLERDAFMIRYYTVFNYNQTNIEIKAVDSETEQTFKDADKLEVEYTKTEGIKIVHDAKTTPSYSPIDDDIRMPSRSGFSSEAEYHTTFFHEMVHSTGHKDRLSRTGITDLKRMGDNNYSKEELIAEIGANFLNAECGVESEAIKKNSQSYIDHWIKALKTTPQILLQAGKKAEESVTYILDKAGKKA